MTISALRDTLKTGVSVRVRLKRHATGPLSGGIIVTGHGPRGLTTSLGYGDSLTYVLTPWPNTVNYDALIHNTWHPIEND